MIGPLPEDITREADLVNGSKMLSNAIVRARNGTLGPNDTPTWIKWGDNGGNEMRGQGRLKPDVQARVDERIAERQRMETRPRVNRDPCFKCGVRADVGCGCKPTMRDILTDTRHIDRAWNEAIDQGRIVAGYPDVLK